jgi:UDP-2,3-diacylglucosamine hydrolase
VIAVIADSHLGESLGDERPFFRALSQIRAGHPREIHLLGDIFRYLIGDPKFSHPVLDRFVEEVRHARSDGVRVVYVEGNRDFFLRGSYLQKEFDAVVPEASFREGGKSFLLVHGDGINERDWPYRFWKAVSKNPISRFVMRLIPGKAANAIASAMERRLRDTNFKHKSQLPVEMIRGFAERRLSEGFDVVLLGHFHEAWECEVGRGRVAIVPPFLEERRWVEVDASGQMRVVALS